MTSAVTTTATTVGAPGARATAPGGTRLRGMDAARGLAVLGMMAVHSLYDTTADGSATTMYLVTAGRSAAMFAVLAGVGIAFTTGRRRVSDAAEGRRAVSGLATRGLVVGILGLTLGYTDVSIAANILPYYAVLFLFAIPLVFLPTGTLLALGVVVATAVPFVSHLLRPGLPEPTLVNPSFTALGDPLGLLSELAVSGYYPAAPWLAYLCVGIAIGRLRLSSARVAAGMLGIGAGVAVAATATSAWLLGPLGGLEQIRLVTPADQLATAPTIGEFVTIYPEGVTPTTTWWWLATDAPHSGTPLDLMQTAGSALAVLGGMLLLGHVTWPSAARLVGAVTNPLAAVGALTLTVYTAHLVFLNSPLDQFGPVAGYVVQVVAAVLFAVGWRRAVGRGPLESLVRVLAQGAGGLAARKTR